MSGDGVHEAVGAEDGRRWWRCWSRPRRILEVQKLPEDAMQAIALSGVVGFCFVAIASLDGLLDTIVSRSSLYFLCFFFFFVRYEGNHRDRSHNSLDMAVAVGAAFVVYRG